jgi:tRNA (Thr-GGU) A37 N-methylase
MLEIGDVDTVSGTPVIDIRTYVPAFDSRVECSVGWFAQN